MFLFRIYFFLTNSSVEERLARTTKNRLRHNATGIETDDTCLTEQMLTFGSLGKWISSHGSGSQVPRVNVVNSFMLSTPWAAAAATVGSAAVAAAAGEVAQP